MNTYTEAEVGALLKAIAGDRLAHAWELALCGLRRGEIAGLRWSDIDFGAKTLSIVNNRVDADGKAVEGDPSPRRPGGRCPARPPCRGPGKPRSDVRQSNALPLVAGTGSTSSAMRSETHTIRKYCRGYWRDAVEAAGFAPDQVARCQAHGRHPYASQPGADRGSCGMDRPQRRESDDADVCTPRSTTP